MNTATIEKYLEDYNNRVIELSEGIKEQREDYYSIKDEEINSDVFDMMIGFEQELKGVFIGYNIKSDKKYILKQKCVLKVREIRNYIMNKIIEQKVCTYDIITRPSEPEDNEMYIY